MAKLFSTLIVHMKAIDATLTERARPPRRGFELAVHPSVTRRAEDRPNTGSRSPRYR
jgi:hypothetical protein